MEIFYTLFAARLIFFLGMLNIVSGVAVLITCRCIGVSSISGRLMRYSWFQRFYSLHCYIWWIFWISVIIHAIFAIGVSGIPF